MTNEFAVIGEHREDNTNLLVLGADGRYYEYDPAHEQFSTIEPDERWLRFSSTEEHVPEFSST